MELYQIFLLIPIILLPISFWLYLRTVPKCKVCNRKMRTPTTNPNDKRWYCSYCKKQKVGGVE